jgi:hypothetical protein
MTIIMVMDKTLPLANDGRIDEDVALLEKPFNPETLLRKVREVLEAEAAETPPRGQKYS